VRVGYSRRFKDRYLVAKEQIVQGRIGKVIGAAMRVYNSRSQALAMLGRNPHATPVVDALTYYVDLANWLLDDGAPVEVYARGQKGVLKAAGHEVDDVSWAILTYASGAVVNLGVCYALPEKYPSLGHAARVGERGYTLGCFHTGFDGTRAVFNYYKQGWAKAGRKGPVPLDRLGYSALMYVGDTEEEGRYQIVGEHEADVKAGKISLTSPLSRALIGKEVGDAIEVNTPGGVKAYEVIKVEWI